MKVLHVGCGHEPLPAWLPDCEEVRLDIEPSTRPDIVASMTDMGDIGGFDAVYSSHSLEHLYPHDVDKALREFRRVLAPGGRVLIFVPDLEDVRPTEDVLYISAAGPVCGLDMIYGMRSMVESLPFMAHRTGFTAGTLKAAFERAGFRDVGVSRLKDWNLCGVGFA